MNSYRTRVERGARWLDENFPGWEKRINIKTLDLESGHSCICGQVFEKKAERTGWVGSGYDYATSHLFAQANGWIRVSMKADDRASKVSDYLGFSTDGSYDRLEKEWIDLLTIRAAKRILTRRANVSK